MPSAKIFDGQRAQRAALGVLDDHDRPRERHGAEHGEQVRVAQAPGPRGHLALEGGHRAVAAELVAAPLGGHDAAGERGQVHACRETAGHSAAGMRIRTP